MEIEIGTRWVPFGKQVKWVTSRERSRKRDEQITKKGQTILEPRGSRSTWKAREGRART